MLGCGLVGLVGIEMSSTDVALVVFTPPPTLAASASKNRLYFPSDGLFQENVTGTIR